MTIIGLGFWFTGCTQVVTTPVSVAGAAVGATIDVAGSAAGAVVHAASGGDEEESGES